ncbi:MAG: hypothetical protein CVT65_18620, partial [Actinobacteria bacterium HGW-Actinobacteria-5]
MRAGSAVPGSRGLSALEGADAALIEEFLYTLLTPAEADEMAKRWALVKELSKGMAQRKIAEELG